MANEKPLKINATFDQAMGLFAKPIKNKVDLNDGWTKIEDTNDIDLEESYMVYSKKDTFLFRKPKHGHQLVNMFMAGEASHFKKA